MRYEHHPPSLTYVGEWNRALGFVARPPGVRDDREDLGRELVNWGEPVLQGPNETEDFESVLLENIDLKYDTRQPTSRARYTRLSHLSLI